MPYDKILEDLRRVREAFPDKQIHVFGMGGIATLHLIALLGMNSADSTGWRNRAARGIIQLPGSGDRIVAELGKWQIPRPSPEEWIRLESCQCPACKQHGLQGLKMNGNLGFCSRATHNLWTLLKESKLIEKHLEDGTYSKWYRGHLYNSIFRPLIDKTVIMHEV
jgi:7-cyano-7-deazaguanine tRNA-ribosyltransferase